jgi:TetR/AcrR family transcriptional repressor of mexJK operon
MKKSASVKPVKSGSRHTKRAPRRKMGRPTREQAELLYAQLLDQALEIFLDRGFEQTTMDAIAQGAGMSKRTLYVRYDDKAALFKAAVQQAIEHWIVPLRELDGLDTDDLEGTLRAVARIGVEQVVSPVGAQIQRIMHAASYRFPEVFTAMYEQGPRTIVEYLTKLLAKHQAAGHINVPRPEIAALVFLRMVPGGSTRGALTGFQADLAEVEELIDYSIKMFLDAVRIRQAG